MPHPTTGPRPLGSPAECAMEHTKVGLAPGLVDMLESRGGVFSEKVAVAESPNDMGTGVVARQRVAQGEAVTVLPQSLGITPERARRDDEIGQILRDSALNDIMCLHIFIAYHKKIGDASPWAQYIATLPESPAVPIFFNENEISLLNPSAAFDRLGWAVEELSSEYHTFSELGLFTGALNCVDLASYRWATAICLSRLFFIGGAPVLLPIVDVYNHHPAKGGELQKDGHSYVLHARCDVEEGEEVFVTYGAGGPEAYFFHYGFVDPPGAVLAKLPVGTSAQPIDPTTRAAPWWLNHMLTPDAEFCDTVIEYDEDIHLLMRDVVPEADGAFDIEVPPEFASDLKLDVAGCLKLFEHLVDMGGPQIDTRRFALSFGRDKSAGTVLMEPASLCALRLLCTVEDEMQTWFHACEGKPVGPRSEVAAVAVLTAALRGRLERLAASFAEIAKQLNVAPSEGGTWAFTGPPPESFSRLCQIGGVLCYETILMQRLLEEAAVVPFQYLTVKTGKPTNVRWR